MEWDVTGLVEMLFEGTEMQCAEAGRSSKHPSIHTQSSKQIVCVCEVGESEKRRREQNGGDLGERKTRISEQISNYGYNM